ncbi:M24 family metallopeptidase [Dyella psychrodurans]|uniref:Aminopeptidase P family protein n=1 Tax=Dyella psychrodurans TaxID=1927960 RepID=A0A370X4Z5_9GAMM|nr:M24 family metallopeptidase [Dyella psychrodurans]RDS83458.1 aminopeptidase P family protein [Dyella psychrodurans]
MTLHHREAVGNRFDPASMLRARSLSWTALHAIRDRMHAGIGEEEAKTVAAGVFQELGMERLWHPPIIRIGPNTIKTYRQPSIPDVRLGENDIYFIDLGLVFDGHEGDVGDTFTVGHAPERQTCAQAARDLFTDVAAVWRREGLSGHNLYNYANERAEAMGWRFNHAIKGHRVSDFPHSVHKGGDLGDFENRPSSGLWVLEIQIAHPTEPFGAFYEDLLTDAAPEGARQHSETLDTH